MNQFWNIKKKGDKVTLYAPDGFHNPGSKLMIMKDNGNGYTVKWYSQSSVEADIYLSLDYSQAADLYMALSEFAPGLLGLPVKAKSP